MGTNNFYNKNASRIYAWELEDDFSYDDLISNLNYELKNIKSYEVEENHQYNNERDYCGVYINSLCFTLRDSLLRVMPIVRSGYYEGCNLDYEVEIVIDNGIYEFKTVKDMVESLKRDNKPYKQLEKSFTKHLKIMIEIVEEIFKNNSTPLQKVAQFSNGEAVYQKQ